MGKESSLFYEVKELFQKRYAAKEFEEKQISDELVNEIISSSLLAPSSYNLQPWKIIIVKNQETKEKLFPFSYNQKQITTCSHLLVLCANTNREEILENFKEMSLKHYPEDQVNERIVYLRNYLYSKDEKELLHYSQLQVYILSSFLMIAAKSAGIDSCPMAGFMPSKYSEILDLDEFTVPTLLLPLGYGKEKKEKMRYSFRKLVSFYP